MNKNALVVSFFKSNNLGDLALSEALESLVEKKGFNVTKYDFLEVEKIDKNNKEIIFQDKKSINTKKKFLKKILEPIFGKNNLTNLSYKLRNVSNRVNWHNFETELKKQDVLIIGGGNMIMDIVPIWPDIFQKYCEIGKKFNKDIYVVSVGAGPIIYKKSKKKIKKALNNVKYISVRDSISKKCLSEFVSESKINETIDPVFSLDINFKKSKLEKINQNDNLRSIHIGICVLGKVCFNNKEDHQKYLLALTNLIKTINANINNLHLTLFSTESLDYKSVIYLSQKLEELEIKNVVKFINKISELTQFYKGIDFLIGGRMHSLIFAQKCTVPYIGLIWQEKIRGFSKITNSTNRVYEVDEIFGKNMEIVERIRKDISNPNVILEMDNINNKLKDYLDERSIFL